MSTLPQATIERIKKNAETWGVNTLQNFAYIQGAQSESLRNLENEQEIQRLKEALSQVTKQIQILMDYCVEHGLVDLDDEIDGLRDYRAAVQNAELLLSQPSQNKEA